MKKVVVLALVAAGLALTGCIPVKGTAPPACEPSPDFSQQMLAAVNADRDANGGRAPVESAADLDRIAQRWAEHLAAAGALQHSPESHRLYERGGSTFAANENVAGPAVGCLSAQAFEATWMTSPAHRGNILELGWQTLGVGVAVDAHGRLWAVQEFGR